MIRSTIKNIFVCCTCMFLLATHVSVATANDRTCSVAAFDFFWVGQFAGFKVNGRFSYNTNGVGDNGIVREQDLLALDVSFYDPQGTLLRTYADNHKTPVDKNGRPYVNFAFDTRTEQLLQTGTFNVDDDKRHFRNGFLMGEGDPELRYKPGAQTGLAFWSRPADNKIIHIHVDDWDDGDGNGEFGFPVGFSSHEDAAFMTKTTQNRIDTQKVGGAYFERDDSGKVVVNNLASDFSQFGQWVRVVRSDDDALNQRDDGRCRARIAGRAGE